MPTGRPVLNVALDEQTADELRAFTESQGVSMTSLVEAFVRALLRAYSSGRPPTWVRGIVAEARQIDAERRRRR